MHDSRAVVGQLDELDRDPLQPQQPAGTDIDVLNLNLKLRTLGHARDLIFVTMNCSTQP